MKLRDCVIADYYRRWSGMKSRARLFKILHLMFAVFISPTFATIFWYRVTSVIPPPVRYFTYVFYKLNSYVTGIQIPIGTKVGKGLTFPHYSCIVISKRAMIGENCTIFQGVTLGKTRKGCPIIGDNVTICANSTVIGKIRIGNNVLIGAGSVVIDDVPDNAVVVGNPAKVVSYNGADEGRYYGS